MTFTVLDAIDSLLLPSDVDRDVLALGRDIVSRLEEPRDVSVSRGESLEISIHVGRGYLFFNGSWDPKGVSHQYLYSLPLNEEIYRQTDRVQRLGSDLGCPPRLFIDRHALDSIWPIREMGWLHYLDFPAFWFAAHHISPEDMQRHVDLILAFEDSLVGL